LGETPSPSTITVAGTVNASGNNAISIDGSDGVSNYVLIEAASGITSTAPYSLYAPDMVAAVLSVNSPTQLLLNAQTTGIDEVSNTNGLTIYPNPFTDVLQLSNVENITSINVSDISGKTVKTISASAEINLSELNSGVYFLHVTLKNGEFQTVKVVKK
jgi:hypothetical protein